MVLIRIEQIGVNLTWSALGQQIECQLLPNFNIISEFVHFATLLVTYSPYVVLYIAFYSSLTQCAIIVPESFSTICLFSIDCYVGAHVWWKRKKIVLEQDLRPMTSFLTAWGTTKREHHSLNKKPCIIIWNCSSLLQIGSPFCWDYEHYNSVKWICNGYANILLGNLLI